MKILAIESSCDDTAAAVVEGRKVLSSVLASQTEEHAKYGGVVPEIASRRHSDNIVCLTEAALKNDDLTLNDIDAVAVTFAPGLIGALLVGVNFAKGLAKSLEKPLIPVHHLRSHIAANYLSHQELKPPFLALVVSGGHSHIVKVSDYTSFEVLGQTRDDAVGECFDKTARAMGMPYPGGVYLDKAAEEGDPNAFSFPHPKVSGNALDFSFSGFKTAVINTLHNASQKGVEINTKDMSASIRRAAVDMLLKNFLAASKEHNINKLVIAGGVSANLLLRRKLTALSDKGYEVYMPDLKYCGDNAAMVGAQALYEFEAGNIADMSLNAVATMPIEKVDF
ncbi:MAG: tRNA (adenosine(37)-N6)-threonylcarbamoyltransferase complex transferase subunit TsaD [Clostridia bacterium]|nr:tRNA (adenosine(37)-N6)-threonylcarbamoyltransferase complex transferase subunit TsaD [Clostridia bacterium]